MSAFLSLVRMWLYGLSVFAAMTASLAVAFGLAITGPPTDEELSGLRAVLGTAGRNIGNLAERGASDFCNAMPEACGVEQTAAPAPRVHTPEIAPPPARAERAPEETDIALAPPDDSALLGGANIDPPRVTVEPVRAAAPRATQRRQRAETPPRRRAPVREVRAARPPLHSPQRAPVEDLAQAPREELRDVPAAYEPLLPPDQREQQEMHPEERDDRRYDDWQEQWPAEPYPEDEYEPEPPEYWRPYY